jgi:hypothetical protein
VLLMHQHGVLARLLDDAIRQDATTIPDPAVAAQLLAERAWVVAATNINAASVLAGGVSADDLGVLFRSATVFLLASGPTR